jgi:hypothetical protein
MSLLDFDTAAFVVRSWRMGLQMGEVTWLSRRLEGMS